jgi:hypothetical protein
MVFSSGDKGSGLRTITEPKQAKNAIVVGSSRNYRSGEDIRGIEPLSSRGPAEDGRILPTVVAPGMEIVSCRSTALKSDGTRAGFSFTDTAGAVHLDHSNRSGTSMAAAHVSGMCALVIQWWMRRFLNARPSPAMLKALLVNGAVDLSGGPDGTGHDLDPIPNHHQGWGRVSLLNVVAREPKVLHDQLTPLTVTGEIHLLRVRADDPAQPLKITLAWTDPPGGAFKRPALINDLDLEVTAATTGTLFKGNVFDRGFSVAGGANDDVSNLECVYVPPPISETFDVRVIASALRGNALPPFNGPAWQDYALVIDNAVALGELEIHKPVEPD